MNNQIKKELISAIQQICVQYPFFYKILINMNIKSTNKITTVFVCFEDGNYCIYYNPEFMSQQNTEQIMFILMHEVLHVVLDHLIRGKDKDRFIYNLAADALINQYLVDLIGKQPLENIILCPPDYNGPKITEFLYEYFLKNKQLISPEELDFNKIDEEIQHIKPCDIPEAQAKSVVVLQDALKNVRSDSIDDLIQHAIKNKKLIKVQKNIKRALVDMIFQMESEKTFYQDKITKKVKVRTFCRPDKKMMSVMPNVVFKGVSTKITTSLLHVVMDVSGSMFTTIANEELVSYSFRLLASNLRYAYLYLADTSVYPYGLINLNDILNGKIIIHGGGGTDFQEAFDNILQSKVKPYIVIITDGLAPNVNLHNKPCYILVLFYDKPLIFSNRKNSKITQIKIIHS